MKSKNLQIKEIYQPLLRRYTKLGSTLLLLLVSWVFFATGCKKVTEETGKIGICPTVVSTDPANGAINVVTSKIITATFNEEMNAGTINVITFTLKQGTTPVLGTVTYAGKVATFTPENPLAPNAVFTGTITSASMDSAKNSLPVNYVWSFNTGNIPVVVATDPINGAADVALGKIITATFSTNMNPSTVNGTSFIVRQAGNIVAGAVTFSGMVATFTPAAPLLPNTVFTSTITNSVRDVLGNAMASNYTWSFGTGAAPVVVATNPADQATNVVLNKVITATFSKLMDVTTINTTNFTIQQGTTLVPGTVTYIGKTAYFTPTNALATNVLFTATITTGVKDTTGNSLAANYVWSFTTGNAPVVIATDPANGAVNVPLNKIITVSFSTAMDASTISATSVLLKQGTNAVAGTVTYVGTTATFTPASPLIVNTLYTGTITTKAKDLLGNALASNYNFSFTTTGNAPVVIATDPANGTVNVPFNKIITVNFNKAMDPSTINVLTVMLKQGNNQVFGTVTYTGTTATFTPANPLAANSVFTGTVTIDAKDVMGNGIVSNYTWSFTTASNPLPTVIATDPTNGASGVPYDKMITATFSEVMNAATINAATYMVKQGANPVAGVVTYSGTTATFNPTTNLANNTVYTATITTGAKDQFGGSLANSYTWSFTTVNHPLPVVIATDPTNGAINVVTSKIIAATFSEAMNSATINGATFLLEQGGNPVLGVVGYSGNTATFNTIINLVANTVYTATITTGAKDQFGGGLANNYTWSFTTASNPPPTVIATDPISGAINVSTAKIVAATFSEAMNGATINATSFLLQQGANPVAGVVAYSGTTATFNPTANLAANTIYTATITTGAKNTASTALANNYTWSFTTASNPPPTVIATDPVNGATNVIATKIIAATFSEAMNGTTINAASFLLQQGANPVAGVVAYSGTTATFNPVANLASNTVYTATITTSAKNSSGTALANNYTWSFTTAAPAILPPFLGSASVMGAFGGNAGVTNQGTNTVINNGAIATTAASTLITGFHDGITGDVYTETPLNKGNVKLGIFTAPPAPGTGSSFTTASSASLDAIAAYNSISPASKLGGIDPGAGELGGLTLAPGTYKAAAGTFNISNGNLTLDAKGDPNAIWIFQTAAGLTVGVAGPAGARSVLLINGAQSKNVFWYVGSAAVINGAGGGVMTGTIMASSGVTFSTAGNVVQTVLNGRAISLVASVTMVNTTINVPN